jgi:FeS assembly SUF system regulator
MFKLSKTTDYGIVLLARLANEPDGAPRNARELAAESDLPVPMVSKVLKALAKEGLLTSQRGSKGGYRLARPPEDVSVSEMIRVLEGPVALTDCAIAPSICEHETLCAVREPWQLISRVVERALADVSLADLVDRHSRPAFASLSQTLQIERSNLHESQPNDAARASRGR